MPNRSFVRQTSYSAIVSQNLSESNLNSHSSIAANLNNIEKDKKFSYQNQRQKTSRLPQQQQSVSSNINERTVFVAELEPNCTENDLFNIFKLHGQVAKICKQPNTTYAYVTFDKAETAKDVVRQTILRMDQRTIRVMPYNQPEVFDENANLIIKNLETYIDESDLIRRFKCFGEILSCKVARFDNGKSKCFAYLQFKNVKSANLAIDEMNNTYWDENYDPDKQYKLYRYLALKPNTNFDTNYFCMPISNTLQYPISPTGSTISSKHNSNSDAESNLIKGKKLYVGVFKKKDDYNKLKNEKEGLKSNLYVKNLGTDFGDRDLFTLFKHFGSIKSVKIRRQKQTNKPLGCGFVDYEEPQVAERARLALDGYIFTDSYGVNRVLSVRYANCKTRKERNAEMMMSNQVFNNITNNTDINENMHLSSTSTSQSIDIMSSNTSQACLNDDIFYTNSIPFNEFTNSNNNLIAQNFNLETWQTTSHKREWYDRWSSTGKEYSLF